MTRNQDSRRVLFDLSNGGYKSVKAVLILKMSTVGGHYHKKKDEEFLLLKGMFIELEVGDLKLKNVKAPYHVVVNRGTYHRFICRGGSVLIGTATELFDETDDYK